MDSGSLEEVVTRYESGECGSGGGEGGPGEGRLGSLVRPDSAYEGKLGGEKLIQSRAGTQ